MRHLPRLAAEALWVLTVIAEGGEFAISGGLHPTVEAALAADGKRPTPNFVASLNGAPTDPGPVVRYDVKGGGAA